MARLTDPILVMLLLLLLTCYCWGDAVQKALDSVVFFQI